MAKLEAKYDHHRKKEVHHIGSVADTCCGCQPLHKLRETRPGNGD
jgi:hypothetical protein